MLCNSLFAGVEIHFKFRSECEGTNRKLGEKKKKEDKVLLCEALKWSRDSHSACVSRSILRNVFRSELT